MAEPSRMPRYDIRNDGVGPYAVFYCDKCEREYRSTPDVANTITRDIGKQAVGGFLRNIPLVGGSIANNVTGEDPRYSHTMNPQQLQAAWNQVNKYFQECPTCRLIVCLSDFDTQSGYCNDDSPRQDQIAEARGQQAGAALKGIANAFGFGDAIEKATKAAQEAARQAETQLARCPNDGTTAPAGTKFCPECGTAMVQPSVPKCPSCGAETHGAKFCPNCGAKQEAPKPAGVCPSCGAQVGNARFCPECGAKVG